MHRFHATPLHSLRIIENLQLQRWHFSYSAIYQSNLLPYMLLVPCSVVDLLREFVRYPYCSAALKSSYLLDGQYENETNWGILVLTLSKITVIFNIYVKRICPLFIQKLIQVSVEQYLLQSSNFGNLFWTNLFLIWGRDCDCTLYHLESHEYIK